MSERVKAYFEDLKNRSSEDLDLEAKEFAACEKQNEARLIASIAEIAARKYHLKLGYKNLFDYCLKSFNLGEGAVWRRTQVARVCRKYPQILEALFCGRLHLTGASLIAPYLKADNVESLIKKAEGKTKRELSKILVTLKPKKLFKSSLRKLSSNDSKGVARNGSLRPLKSEDVDVEGVDQKASGSALNSKAT